MTAAKVFEEIFHSGEVEAGELDRSRVKTLRLPDQLNISRFEMFFSALAPAQLVWKVSRERRLILIGPRSWNKHSLRRSLALAKSVVSALMKER